jgi:hypothetical protein
MARSITCTNNDGSTIKFGEDGFNPFILAHVEGIYSVQNNVFITQNTMIDGGTYQSSVTKIRNIVLTVMDRPENKYGIQSRDVLYTLFPKGTMGTLTYTEDEESRIIDYYVESIEKDSPKNRLYTISLLCADPFFYAPTPVSVYMANWISGFEFQHEFLDSGEEFGWRSIERIQNILNENATDNIGMKIIVRATGPATNLKITRIESNESIKIGSSENQFNMVSSDELVITTSNGDKHVRLTRNGETREVNQYLTEDSEFIQLMRGNNSIGYSADSGESNLEIEIQYRLKFEGA